MEGWRLRRRTSRRRSMMSSETRAAVEATGLQDRTHRRRRRAKARGVTALMYAAQQGDVDRVRRIIRAQSSSLFDRDRTGKTALHYCCTSDNICAAHAADLLVMAAPDLVEGRDEDGFTPLHLAVIAGNIQLVTFLLANNADVNAVDNEKHTVVHWATVCGETAALRAVLAAGAPVSTPDLHGGYPLHYAAQMCGGANNDRDSSLGMQVLQTLLNHKDIVVSVTDGDKRQPLLWAASAGSAKAVLALVRAGAAVEAADKDGLTALHCAASRGHTDCLDTLLTLCGASPDVIDTNGCTALHYAVTLGHADATALLLAHGADPNRQDRKGRSPAHCGCAKGQFETVKLIGAHRAKLWLRNARGDFPLHEAAASGRRDLVKWLLEMRPSQVNARNNDGRCPLHMAALNDNADMCKILLDTGAQVNPVLRTSRNVFMTPLDCALQRGFRSTAKYLQLHGGVPANRLAELKSHPSSGLNLQIRDDVTFWGDTSSESEKEHGEANNSGKKSYRKNAHKLEKSKASLTGSEEEIVKLESSKLESSEKPKKKSGERIKEKSSAKSENSTPISSSKRSSSKKLPSSRMEYTNEIIINGKTEINIHQTREIIVEKEPILVDKITETVISENIIPQSASSVKERRPRSAKFSKGRERSGRSSVEKGSAKSRRSTASPETVIQQEKASRQGSLRAQTTNTSEETTDTVIENKKFQPAAVVAENSFDKNLDTRKLHDQQSLLSNTSEDVEEHKDFIVEAAVHEPPKSHLERTESKGQELVQKELIPEAKEKDEVQKVNQENEKSVTEKNEENNEIEKGQTQIEEVKMKDTDTIASQQEISPEKKTEDSKPKEDADVDGSKPDTNDDTEQGKSSSPSEDTPTKAVIDGVVTEGISSEMKDDIKHEQAKETSHLQTEDEVATTKAEKDIQKFLQEEKTLEGQILNDDIKETEVVNDLIKDVRKMSNEYKTKENDELLEKDIKSTSEQSEQIESEVGSTENSNMQYDKGNKLSVVEAETSLNDPEEVDSKIIIDKEPEESAIKDNQKQIQNEDLEKTFQISVDLNDNNVTEQTKAKSLSHEVGNELSENSKEEFEQARVTTEKETAKEIEVTKKRATKDKKSKQNKSRDISGTDNKAKDVDTKRKNRLKAEKPSTTSTSKGKEEYSDEYSSHSEDVSASTPTKKPHKSFRVLDEGEGEKLNKTKPRKTKTSAKKESRSRSEENKKKDRSKEREKFKYSKIPTPLGRTMLSKSDRHLDKSPTIEKRAIQAVLDGRVPSLPNIYHDKVRLKEPPRPESNMSAPLLASLYSDESMSDVEPESRNLVARNKKRIKKRSKTREARSAGSDYESSNLIDSGFEPSPRSTRIPKWRNISDRGVNMTSVTQNIQSNIRKYHLERKIFQHLLELKRHQIRAGQHNEAVLVKRAIDAYHQSCASTVGAGRYIPEDYTFKSFEQFLYESLRKLQKRDVEYMKGLPEAPTNPLLCTRSTNRCMHATHAYTGVPCAAYLPKMDHHTIPKIGYNNVNCKPGNRFSTKY